MSDREIPEDVRRRRSRLRDGLLISLTFATGVADAASYLGLGQIFTANMTGNTVFLALAIGQGNVLTAAHSVAALAGFGAGVFLAGRKLELIRDSDPWPRPVTIVLGAELLFAASFTTLWVLVGGRPETLAVYALIALSSFGMGMQSAVGRTLAVPGVSTNVLTMAFTGLMAELAAVGISGTTQRRWAAAILAMGAGAAVGAVLFVDARPVVPIPMLAILIAVFVIAWRSSGGLSGRPAGA